MAKTLEESVNVLHNLFLSKPTLTDSDADTLKMLFEVLENNAKIELFNILAGATERSAIINFLDEMLDKYQASLVSLKNKADGIDASKEIQKYEELINYVNSMKSAYIKKDFKGLTESFFGKAMSLEDTLKKACLSSLASGYNAFISLYDEFILDGVNAKNGGVYTPDINEVNDNIKINSNYLDNAFEILLDAEKMKTFREYFRLKHASKYLLVVEKDKMRTVAYDEIANNLPAVKEIADLIIKCHKLRALIKAGKTEADFNYFEDDEEDYTKKSALWKLIHKDKINKALEHQKLLSQIDSDSEELKTLENKLDTLFEGFSLDTRKIIEKSLEPIVIGTDDNERFFLDELKGFILSEDMERAKQSLQQKSAELKIVIHKNEELLATRKDKFDSFANDMPEDAKALLEKDEQGIENIVMLDQRCIRYNRTPLVCAYILKILSDSKKIAPEEMLNSLGTIDYSNLASEYQNYFDTYLSDTLNQVKNDVTIQEKSL